MPRCLRCDNTGMVIEYRLVWKVLAVMGAPLDGSLRVDSEAEGWQEAAKLGQHALDVDVISGARKCPCRLAIPKRERRPVKAKPPEPKPETRDWKMAQAGDC